MSSNKQEISCFNAGHWNGFRKKTGEKNSVTVLTIHWNQCQHLKGKNLVNIQKYRLGSVMPYCR